MLQTLLITLQFFLPTMRKPVRGKISIFATTMHLLREREKKTSKLRFQTRLSTSDLFDFFQLMNDAVNGCI